MTNKETVARNFVSDLSGVSRLEIGKGLASNEIEKAARAKHIEQVKELCALRLLFLTGNITEEQFQERGKPVQAKREEMAAIIWPEKE